MSSQTRIAVLGGGYAGIEAAKKLHKHFRKNKNVEITLIDRNPYHTLMTELHEIAGSRTDPESVQISYKRIFSGKRVNVVVDDIESIDFKNRKLKSDVAEYEYDYLVIGTGGRPEFFGIEGIQQNSFTLWSLEDAIRIREHIEHMFRMAAKEPHPEIRKQQLTFVIAGAGFTGIELVGEIMERADLLCYEYHIDREEVNIIVVEARDCILPILKDGPRKKARKYLEKYGVEIILDAPVVKGEPGKFHLKDGRILETKTFVWTGGVQGSGFTAKIELTKGKVSNDECSIATDEGIHGMAACYFDEDEQEIVGQRGRILVNEHMQSVDYPNVYLAGDMIWYLHDEKVLPQIVENALQSAETAAENIIASIENKKPKAYNPKFHGFMVSIGSRYAVASVTGINATGFIAMALKHLVNFHYLWNLAGFNACWNYFKEEFIDIKNERSITRGHTSARVPAFFLLPARLWLGLMWIMEGINKIGEGWLHLDKSRSGWMFSQGVKQAGDVTAAVSSGGADAVTAVSEEVVEAAPAVVEPVADALAAASEWVEETVAGTAEAVSAAGTQAAESFQKVWDLSKPVFSPDSALVTWFRQTFMDGIASQLHFGFFQVMIVVVEIALGLAIFGGFLTLPAAVVSIAMCLVFIFSGMFSWTQLWFIFIAIALMGGAGRSFGLDHYISPRLGKLWSSTKLAKRSYLYAGEPGKKKSRKRKRNG